MDRQKDRYETDGRRGRLTHMRPTEKETSIRKTRRIDRQTDGRTDKWRGRQKDR
jgi:hypothetical protein